MSIADLFGRFLLQLVVILATCQLLGLLVQRLGQPRVLGEISGGILLGPSLLGTILPGVQGDLFPGATVPTLNAMSQFVLVLFMFLVGLELDLSVFHSRVRSAAAVSLGGVLVPLVLGMALAAFLADDPRYFPPGNARWTAIGFLGVAMSITALPVLARILQERGLLTTPVGTIALGAGAVSDAVAWCLLAALLAGVQREPKRALVAAGGTLLYVALVVLLARPLLGRLTSLYDRRQAGTSLLPIILVLVLLGAWFTDFIGLHAVFGAFLLGTAVPQTRLAIELRESLEQITYLLLPLYFAYSGLNTHVRALNSPALWGIFCLILLVAFAGKGVACWLIARLSGQSRRDAITIGALMNARGLVELIVLNVGLEHGIISPTLFTMMVLMALGTTAMTSPIVAAAYRSTGGAPVPAFQQTDPG